MVILRQNAGRDHLMVFERRESPSGQMKRHLDPSGVIIRPSFQRWSACGAELTMAS
jgi:hypothetical protein